jgi:hypothetical protein
VYIDNGMTISSWKEEWGRDDGIDVYMYSEKWGRLRVRYKYVRREGNYELLRLALSSSDP